MKKYVAINHTSRSPLFCSRTNLYCNTTKLVHSHQPKSSKLKMNWGRKNSSPSASTVTASSPLPCFPTLKKTGDLEGISATKKERSKLDFHASNSSVASGLSQRGVYGAIDDDGAYWSISFDEERTQSRGSKSRAGLSWSYSAAEDEFQTMENQRKEENGSFNDTVYDDLRKTKEKKDHKSCRLRRWRQRVARSREAEVKRWADSWDVRLPENSKMLDSFAVVKSSFDPQKDFTDSMMEMIRSKQIRNPEELEELLYCYLTLNSDDLHNLIIKVLQHVWLQMKGNTEKE